VSLSQADSDRERYPAPVIEMSLAARESVSIVQADLDASRLGQYKMQLVRAGGTDTDPSIGRGSTRWPLLGRVKHHREPHGNRGPLGSSDRGRVGTRHAWRGRARHLATVRQTSEPARCGGTITRLAGGVACVVVRWDGRTCPRPDRAPEVLTGVQAPQLNHGCAQTPSDEHRCKRSRI